MTLLKVSSISITTHSNYSKTRIYAKVDNFSSVQVSVFSILILLLDPVTGKYTVHMILHTCNLFIE